MNRIMFNKAFTTASASTTRLEVERKFLPTARIDLQLQQLHSDDSSLATQQEGATFKLPNFSRQSDNQIRDTYFDCDAQLEKAGIWLRRRQTRIGFRFALGPTFDVCEAKIRLAGTYVNSEFEEVEGERAVYARIAKMVPGIVFADLQPTVDLMTYRQAWSVAHGGDGGCETHVVLDEVREAEVSDGVHPDGPFKYHIGEVEMVANVSGTGIDSKRESLRKELDAFMDRHRLLFPTSPHLMGKISAYFAWKHRDSEQGR